MTPGGLAPKICSSDWWQHKICVKYVRSCRYMSKLNDIHKKIKFHL